MYLKFTMTQIIISIILYMNFTIDKIFNSKSYRYIPTNIRNEWKNLYNYYSCDYYQKLLNSNKLSGQIHIDLYNEQKDKLDKLLTQIKQFEIKINDIKPLYESDKLYSEEIQSQLRNSFYLMKLFVNERKQEINTVINEKNIPIRTQDYNIDSGNIIEHYQQNPKKKNNFYKIIVISLLLFILYWTFIK